MTAGTAIRAIETTYAGCAFRSRLEARWAVFFDALGVAWQYEPEGFIVTDMASKATTPYLPDFFLSDLGTWVEVKGDWSSVDDEYFAMLANAVDWGGCLPGVANSLGTPRGLLLLGPIPPDSSGLPVHWMLQHDKGGWVEAAAFSPGARLVVSNNTDRLFDSLWGGESINKLLRPLLTKSLTTAAAADERVRAAYRAARRARFERRPAP